MEENNVPYIVYESEQARNERHIKRIVAALIISIVLMFVTNAAWLVAWCSYDYASEEISIGTNGGGNANFIGNDGDIINGNYQSAAADADEEEQQEQGEASEET